MKINLSLMGYRALWCFGDSSCTVKAGILKKICELEQGLVVLYAFCLILKYSPKNEQQTLSLQSPDKCTCYFTGISVSYDFCKDENQSPTLSHYFPKLFFFTKGWIIIFCFLCFYTYSVSIDIVKVIFPLVFWLLIPGIGNMNIAIW